MRFDQEARLYTAAVDHANRLGNFVGVFPTMHRGARISTNAAIVDARHHGRRELELVDAFTIGMYGDVRNRLGSRVITKLI